MHGRKSTTLQSIKETAVLDDRVVLDRKTRRSKSMRYNILILEALGSFGEDRKCTIDHMRFLERYSSGNHNIMYHSWQQPITSVLRRTNFHVVVLTYSALSLRYLRPRERYYEIRDAWAFIGDMNAVKLAFPQDEYHNTNELDLLFRKLGIDIIYSVLPKHMKMFYPLSAKTSRLKGILTGYVDDDSIYSMSKFNKPFEQRGVDIFQRVRMYAAKGAFCGRYAGIKGRMATCFQERGLARGLKVDISTRTADAVLGGQWLKRLGNSRYALGCEGGVSVWDPDGRYQDLVVEYVKEHGIVPFKEVEAACFPGQDGKYIFSAISPRLFEAAVMGCSQILVEGEYMESLEPWVHYIPVRSDMSDVDDALDAMSDVEAAKGRAEACIETLIDNPALRYSALAREVLQDVERLAVGRGFREVQPERFRKMLADHKSELRQWKTWQECRVDIRL